jgi:uncharacterized protein YbjT (DUF2867 family)
MILITGAAGQTGLAAIRALSQHGADIRILTRSEEGAETCRAAGAQDVMLGDLRSDVDMKAALAGVARVYHIGPAFMADEFEVGVRLIDAAKAEGVEQFAYHSLLNPQVRSLPHRNEKLRVEEYLVDALIPHTILQPTMYMQFIEPAWPSIVEDGVFRPLFNIDIPLALVDLDDVGEAAATMLTQDGWTGGSFEMSSPQQISHTEIAAIFANILGQNIRTEKVEFADWAAAAQARGMDEYSINGFLKIFKHNDECGLPGNPRVLEMILGRAPNDYRAFAEKWVAAHPPQA